jgi:hypothetical protein
MNDKTYSCALPGQAASIHLDKGRKRLGIGFNDQAIRTGSPYIRMDFSQRQARELLTDFISAYEQLYGEPFQPLEDFDDTQRI